MVLNGKKLWMTTRDYLMIVVGIFLFGFGFSAFILPEKVVIGGVTGLGTIVYLLTGKTYAIGVTQYAINLALLSLAYFRSFLIHWCRLNRLWVCVSGRL